MTRSDLQPPVAETLTPANGTQPGSVFLAPIPRSPRSQPSGQPGPLIVDDQGQPVWFAPREPGTVAMDFKAQEYRGAPVLT